MIKIAIIRKLGPNKFRLYSRKKDKSGKRRNLGTFKTLEECKKRERQVQFFKGQHAEDALDEKEKTIKNIENIANFLEEAGFIDQSQTLYDTMAAIDGGMVDDALDMIPDAQRNTENEGNLRPYGAGNSYSSFSVPEAERLAFLKILVKTANDFDKNGLTYEADELDAILEKLVKEYEQENIDMAVNSNGLQGTSVIDNQSAGSFSGLSDSYFYRSYQSDEGAYEHSNQIENKLTP